MLFTSTPLVLVYLQDNNYNIISNSKCPSPALTLLDASGPDVCKAECNNDGICHGFNYIPLSSTDATWFGCTFWTGCQSDDLVTDYVSDRVAYIKVSAHGSEVMRS